jgi:multidrug efflux pump subunit AcrB
MVGAVDNDAVIATDFIIELRRRGVALTQAIFEGVSKRLRAIVMTTLTTIMGIIPLAFNLDGGSQLATALTIPLVGGLISATLFTLITIPVVYYYLDREPDKSS